MDQVVEVIREIDRATECINKYTTMQPQWEKKSSIRTRPRRLLSDEMNPGFYFPPVHQPLALHPFLNDLAPELKERILVLSLYKYLNDIANIEKDVINHVAYRITKDQYFLKFSRAMKHDALSIIVDESYHAYMAQDFMQQVVERTGICRIELPEETALSCAIQQIKNKLPQGSVDHFEFIAVCIAEHALTNDLISVARSEDICKTFYCMMRDHAVDEGRHARYFETMLGIYWSALPASEKDIVGPYLAVLINKYFDPSLQYEYNTRILETLGVEADKIRVILADTHAGWSEDALNGQNVVTKQMVALLKRTKVFATPSVKSSFAKFGID